MLQDFALAGFVGPCKVKNIIFTLGGWAWWYEIEPTQGEIDTVSSHEDLQQWGVGHGFFELGSLSLLVGSQSFLIGVAPIWYLLILLPALNVSHAAPIWYPIPLFCWIPSGCGGARWRASPWSTHLRPVVLLATDVAHLTMSRAITMVVAPPTLATRLLFLKWLGQSISLDEGVVVIRCRVRMSLFMLLILMAGPLMGLGYFSHFIICELIWLGIMYKFFNLKMSGSMVQKINLMWFHLFRLELVPSY